MPDATSKPPPTAPALPQAVEELIRQEAQMIVLTLRPHDPGSWASNEAWLWLVLERFARALERGRAQAPAPDWQPIETAPKDGTLVLVAFIRDGSVLRASDAAFNGLGWYTRNGSACHWRTHWMPLPAPPSTGDSK